MKKKNILLVILALAVVLRFHGLTWDDGAHLHPDERFLSMVANASKVTSSFRAYMDPERSTLNPANVGFTFYVYGVFPLTFTKLLAVHSYNDTYAKITELGRALSALLDVLTMILVYKLAQCLQRKYSWDPDMPLWAAFFYAIAVLPIQLSHFFTVDIFLHFFMFASVYYLYRYSQDRKIYRVIVGALLFGLALSSKLTAVFVLPLILYFIVITRFPPEEWGKIASYTYWKQKGIVMFDVFFDALLFVFLAGLTVRIFNPYMFRSGDILDFQLSKLFVSNIQQLKALTGPDTWFPPSIQWLSKKPVAFSLTNIAFFGLGIPYFLFLVTGLVSVLIPFRATRQFRNHIMVVFAVWTIGFFLYQSTAFVKVMRYFIFLYPFFAIFAAIGLLAVTRKLKSFGIAALVVVLLIWPVAFSSLYNKPHTRIAASQWIGKNVPHGSVILSEYWDDALPISLPQVKLTDYSSAYVYPFDKDTSEKWKQMSDKLTHADYLVLSSNRGWGSIMAVPDRYPRQSAFYRDLLAGKLLYRKVAEFTSYPSLEYIGIPVSFPDDWADESFTVYDHPKVMIFKNERPVKK